ncbi:orotate phosphoribosyltransferase [Paenibacillus mesotrionivorans]|uniref:Orotate phosphoribosyltransferase n=1 Tax=Paenibacillus mesotrionivorans TaxID=3160968 RepID=A0ACC7NTU8_9BACL
MTTMLDIKAHNVNELIDMVKQSILFDQFKRKSGGSCDYYVHGRRMVLDSGVLLACSNRMLDLAIRLKVSHVGGEVASALPLVGSMITLAAMKGYALDGFFIREAVKDHGFSHMVEGELNNNSTVLLVDDVIGKGSVALRTSRLLRQQGVAVKGFCAIVDRCEGASELLQAEGLELFSLCTTDLLKEWIDHNILLKRKLLHAE